MVNYSRLVGRAQQLPNSDQSRKAEGYCRWRKMRLRQPAQVPRCGWKCSRAGLANRIQCGGFEDCFTTIHDLFWISPNFISKNDHFGDLQDLLDQHFNRLSELEQQMMYCWRQPRTGSNRGSPIWFTLSLTSAILDALDSLQRLTCERSSIYYASACFNGVSSIG